MNRSRKYDPPACKDYDNPMEITAERLQHLIIARKTDLISWRSGPDSTWRSGPDSTTVSFKTKVPRGIR